MTIVQTDALGSLLLLVLLVLFVRGPWRSICTDYARQAIFEHRDAIFDLAVSGELQFDDPNYRIIRIALERNIRFAHALTLSRFFFTLRWMARHPQKKNPDVDRAIASIENEVIRRKVSRHVYLSQRAMIVMMVLKSPLAILVGAVITLLSFLLQSVGTWVKKTLRAVASEVQAEADIAPPPFNNHRHV